MPEEAEAPKGESLGGKLSHKVGPLPTWAYIVGGAVVVWYVMSRGGGGAGGGGGGQMAGLDPGGGGGLPPLPPYVAPVKAQPFWSDPAPMPMLTGSPPAVFTPAPAAPVYTYSAPSQPTPAPFRMPVFSFAPFVPQLIQSPFVSAPFQAPPIAPLIAPLIPPWQQPPSMPPLYSPPAPPPAVVRPGTPAGDPTVWQGFPNLQPWQVSAGGPGGFGYLPQPSVIASPVTPQGTQTLNIFGIPTTFGLSAAAIARGGIPATDVVSAGLAPAPQPISMPSLPPPSYSPPSLPSPFTAQPGTPQYQYQSAGAPPPVPTAATIAFLSQYGYTQPAAAPSYAPPSAPAPAAAPAAPPPQVWIPSGDRPGVG